MNDVLVFLALKRPNNAPNLTDTSMTPLALRVLPAPPATPLNVGNWLLNLIIRMLFDDTEIAWAKIQQEQKRRSGKTYPLHTF